MRSFALRNFAGASPFQAKCLTAWALALNLLYGSTGTSVALCAASDSSTGMPTAAQWRTLKADPKPKKPASYNGLSEETPKLAPNPPEAEATAKAPDASSQATPRISSPVPGNHGEDSYPTVGRMEVAIFGASKADSKIDSRLSELEQAVFKQQYSDQPLFDRAQRLKETVLGIDEIGSDFNSPSLDMGSLGMTGLNLPGLENFMMQPSAPSHADLTYLEGMIRRSENQQPIDDNQAQNFATDLLNYLRSESGALPLRSDEIASKLAHDHVDDLSSRGVISHANANGENPDLRYTKFGGTDSVTESLATVSSSSRQLTKADIARLFKGMIERQDDRDSLMNLDASSFGFAVKPMEHRSSIVCSLEIVTKHGIMQPIDEPLTIGGHLEVKGLIGQPYRFDHISIAWEGQNGSMSAASDESEDALPYFPPLDFISYGPKGEHDYQKTINTLRTVGLIAALAGGMFMPPVALAAPLIMATGSMAGGDPKPLSDIPVHGGVKLAGSTFTGKVHLSNGGKPGLYYITVWATSGMTGKAIPISRRVYSVNGLTAEHSQRHADQVKARVEEKP